MKKEPISTIIQRWLLLCVVIVFGISLAVSYVVNTRLSRQSTKKMLVEYSSSIQSNSNFGYKAVLSYNIMELSSMIDYIMETDPVCSNNRFALSEKLKTQEYLFHIFVVDELGKVFASTIPECIGFDMASDAIFKNYWTLLQPETDDSNPCLVDNLPLMCQEHGDTYIYAGYHSPGKDYACVIAFLPNDTFYNGVVPFILNDVTGSQVPECGITYIFDSDKNLLGVPVTDFEGVNLLDTTISVSELGIDTAIINNREDEVFELDIKGEPCACIISKHKPFFVLDDAMLVSDVYFLTSYPLRFEAKVRDSALRLTIISVFSIFLILFLVTYWLIQRLIVRNVERVIVSLSEITKGNLEESVNVHQTSEFHSLSNDINSMVGKLKEYIHEAETRMDADLAMAKSIQLSSLPSIFPAFPERKEFDIYGGMTAAKEVGGDFYDFFFVTEHQLAFLIADVSGKGVPAALFMMRCKSALKNHLNTGKPLEEACAEVNNMLAEGNDTNTFFTAWVGVIDLRTGLVTYINAGHNAPLYRKEDGTFAYLDCQPNIPMAVFSDFDYQVQTLQLRPGNEIFLYTDGVTEATDVHDKLYGDNRLLETFNTMSVQVAASPERIYQYVLASVQDFAKGAEQSDDITMLCLKYDGVTNNEL